MCLDVHIFPTHAVLPDAGLLINFMHHYWPSLLKIDGFLQEFITPIVKVAKGKNFDGQAFDYRSAVLAEYVDLPMRFCRTVLLLNIRFCNNSAIWRLQSSLLASRQLITCFDSPHAGSHLNLIQSGHTSRGSN